MHVYCENRYNTAIKGICIMRADPTCFARICPQINVNLLSLIVYTYWTRYIYTYMAQNLFFIQVTAKQKPIHKQYHVMSLSKTCTIHNLLEDYHTVVHITRNHPMHATTQWETVLHCDIISLVGRTNKMTQHNTFRDIHQVNIHIYGTESDILLLNRI